VLNETWSPTRGVRFGERMGWACAPDRWID
jgi:hypothetical protein